MIQRILWQLTTTQALTMLLYFCVQSNYVQKLKKEATVYSALVMNLYLIWFLPSPQLVSRLRKIQIAFSPDAIKISRSPCPMYVYIDTM